MSSMDIHEIIKYLPHRYPFLLVDKVIDIVPGKSLTAIKNVTSNEYYFVGHFPQRMVMPGVLILEALAQASGILAFKTAETKPDNGDLYYLAGIDNVRFKKVVEPGDQLRLEVEVIKHKQDIWKFTGKATVDGILVCSADMMSAKRNNKGD
ncbi:MAG: 3-hydroxyacyl-[acyl-carrier-protein] dehydratase FabZ [Legionellaceae bacterium]